MGSLQIQDTFEPYYVGRKPFRSSPEVRPPEAVERDGEKSKSRGQSEAPDGPPGTQKRPAGES